MVSFKFMRKIVESILMDSFFNLVRSMIFPPMATEGID